MSFLFLLDKGSPILDVLTAHIGRKSSWILVFRAHMAHWLG